MEMFKKQLNEGQAGDNVGLLLRGIKREDVVRGQVVCKPGSIKPYKKFEGELYALNKEEGGRHTPFFSNYKPQFFFRTADVTGGPQPLAFPLPHPLRCVGLAFYRCSLISSWGARTSLIPSLHPIYLSSHLSLQPIYL